MKALLLEGKTFITFLILSLFLILLDYLRVLDLPKSFLEKITVPIQYGLYKSSKSALKQFEFIILSRRAAQENKALTEQLATVISENADLRRRLSETQGFLEQQQALDSRTYNLAAARPIALSRYLKIDRGTLQGLKVGMPVVYKDSYIGQIKEVTPNESLVILSSDPDSKIAAFSQNKNGKAKGVLIGQFGSEMLLDKILHQESLSKGDLVYSEGTEGSLPRGLILGQVSQVLERENEVFKQAKLKPVFDIGNLDIVFVITN